MSLRAVDPFADQGPDFNRVVAKKFYDDIMALPDDEAARMYAIMTVAGGLQTDLVVHGRLINRALAKTYADKAEVLKKSLVSGYIAKRNDGQDVQSVIDAVTALSKAWDPDQFDTEARSRRAQSQYRSAGGRFGVSHHRVEYDSSVKKPLPDKHVERLTGRTVHEGAKKLKGEQAARYQQAYAQVSALIAPYTRLGDDAQLHLHYTDGSEVSQALPGSKVPLPIDPDKTLRAASVSVAPGATAGGATFDALRALGNPEMGAALGSNIDRMTPENVRAFGDNWNRSPEGNDNFRPTSRVFRRLESGSRLLNDALGDVAPKKLKYALAVGEHAGKLGPEAQKVLGPGADRASYRYRGTQRKLDDRLVNAAASDRSKLKHPNAQAARNAMIHGQDEIDDRGKMRGWSPSATLRYFQQLLPSKTLNALQLASGNVPPSQGVIFDKTGKAVVQSVGYGDDHYLPFDLTKVAKLRGGEYIRTRSWGGPTTEDVYTGLVSGSRAMTVVSHNGTFTMEFDPTFRGSRRYNDKAAAMVARYGQLLDAVKNGQVATADIDPTRMNEIRRKAELVADPETNRAGWQAEVERLSARERQDPTFSTEQEAQVRADFLGEQLGKINTADGMVMTPDKAREAIVMRAIAAASPERRNEAARYMANQVVSDEGLVNAMGFGNQYASYRQQALDKYKRDLRPLKLDGHGYSAAMDALQEQFPYYIQNVQFHPFPEDAGRGDTGYVKPRHNRPEGALAGYFDRSITGFRKVTADSVRNQNGRSLNFVDGKKGDSRETKKPSEEAARPGLERVRKIQAAKDLAKTMANTRQRPDGSDLPSWVRMPPAGTNAEGRALADVMNMDSDDIDQLAEQEPERFERMVNQAYTAGHGQGLFGEEVKTKHRAYKQGAQKARDFNLDNALLNSSGEFNFGRIYEKGDHDVQDIKNAYGEDGDIQSARGAYNLGELTDEGFLNKINAGIEAAKKAFTGDMANEPRFIERHERQYKGLLKAKQLHLRLNEENAKRAEAAQAEAEMDRVMVVPVSPETAERMATHGVPLNPERQAIGTPMEMPLTEAQRLAEEMVRMAHRNTDNQ